MSGAAELGQLGSVVSVDSGNVGIGNNPANATLGGYSGKLTIDGPGSFYNQSNNYRSPASFSTSGSVTNLAIPLYAGGGSVRAICVAYNTDTLEFTRASNASATGGVTRDMVIDSSGNVGIGITAPNASAKLDVNGGIFTRPGGAGNILFYNSDSTNNYYFNNGGATGSGNGILTIHQGGVAERARFDTQGNFLITSSGLIGYGTGSGGSVTQATSKGTLVTLNKTNGQITTNNAALAAGGIVSFQVTNSTVAATDTIILHRTSGGSDQAYQFSVERAGAGSFIVTIRNTSAGSLSEALVLNFSVIKASTS